MERRKENGFVPSFGSAEPSGATNANEPLPTHTKPI